MISQNILRLIDTLSKRNLRKGIISHPFVQSKDQLADILTKAVASETVDDAICKLGLGEPYDLT